MDAGLISFLVQVGSQLMQDAGSAAHRLSDECPQEEPGDGDE